MPALLINTSHPAVVQDPGEASRDGLIARHVHVDHRHVLRKGFERCLLASVASLGVPHRAPDPVPLVGESLDRALAKSAASPGNDHRLQILVHLLISFFRIKLPHGTIRLWALSRKKYRPV